MNPSENYIITLKELRYVQQSRQGQTKETRLKTVTPSSNNLLQVRQIAVGNDADAVVVAGGHDGGGADVCISCVAVGGG